MRRERVGMWPHGGRTAELLSDGVEHAGLPHLVARVERLDPSVQRREQQPIDERLIVDVVSRPMCAPSAPSVLESFAPGRLGGRETGDEAKPVRGTPSDPRRQQRCL